MSEPRATSELIAITYEDRDRAADVLEALLRLHDEIIELDDVCTVTRDASGRLTLHQWLNTSGATRAPSALWGSLIGGLFLAPLVGMVVAVATGELRGGLHEYGIDADFTTILGANLTPESSALFVLTRVHSAEMVIAELRMFGGTPMRTAIADDAEQRLCAGLRSSAAAAVN